MKKKRISYFEFYWNVIPAGYLIQFHKLKKNCTVLLNKCICASCVRQGFLSYHIFFFREPYFIKILLYYFSMMWLMLKVVN